jgi:hypothetical protein
VAGLPAPTHHCIRAMFGWFGRSLLLINVMADQLLTGRSPPNLMLVPLRMDLGSGMRGCTCMTIPMFPRPAFPAQIGGIPTAERSRFDGVHLHAWKIAFAVTLAQRLVKR